jgi:ParB family transcriptional regulator, chromosome partitioning protein
MRAKRPRSDLGIALGAARRIKDIRLGRRHRRELGDIKGLAASIADIGLLHPITVDQDGRLLAGARRLAAFKLLGRTEIPVNIVKCV